MRNLSGRVVVLLLSTAASAMAPASAAPLPAPDASPQASAAPRASGSVPAAKGRLKFKSAGPVCMCGEGLSERDIEQALARQQSEKAGGQESATRPVPVTGQENNLNLGVTK